MYAIGKNHVEALRERLVRAATSCEPEELLAGLLTAAMIGDTGACAELLDRGADVNSTDQCGRTPLVEAVFGGHFGTAWLLLTRGAEVNAADSDGWTALMEAASKGRTEMVRLLLDWGADPSASSHGGWTALKLASKGNFELTALLREASRPK